MSTDRLSYSPLVCRLFRTLPRAGGPVPGPGSMVHGEARALDRGAWVRLEARVEDGRVVDCAFRAWGCPHVLAAAALAAAQACGQPTGAGLPTDAHRLAAELGSPPEKLGRLLVVEDALRALMAGARALQWR